MQICFGKDVPARRSGAAAVFVMVTLVVMMGFAALTVDVGNLYVAKGDLQRAADAAALAGASAFADDAIRIAAGSDDAFDVLASEAARQRAMAYSVMNPATGVATRLDAGDVVVGYWDAQNPDAPLDLAARPNAVQVTARFTRDSINGPVSNFFASVLGFKSTDVSALAVAAFDTRLSGYTPPSSGPLLPFTVRKQDWEDQLISGPDDFGYDADLNQIEVGGDGDREVVLFPYPDDPEGGDGAGNFGILNIGLDSQSLSEVEGQIDWGVTAEQLEAETGYPELTFLDENGEPMTYDITGNPGMKGGLADALEARIGDVVGFFLYTNLVETGSNAIYTIVAIKFGRVMEVFLTGSPDDRRFRIQPILYTDDGVGTDPGAPLNGEIGRLMLVR